MTARIEREKSKGNVPEKLQSFLYILLRDHLPAGTVEKIALEHCAHQSYSFSNPYIADYAKELCTRLVGEALK